MKAIGHLVTFLWRSLVVVPTKLLAAVTGTAFRAGYEVGRVPVRASRRFARFAGLKGVALFALGAVLGLLLAPVPGRQLRARLAALVGGSGAPNDDELAAAVSFELGHAPRTWHLDQPDVAVHGGRVTLTGTVSDDAARDDLVTVAGGIPGVTGVDDRLRLAGADDADGSADDAEGPGDGDA